MYFDFDSIFQVLEFKKYHIIDWGFQVLGVNIYLKA